MQTPEEFERAYAQRNGMTLEQLREHWTARPCDCSEEICRGWQMMPHHRAAIYDAATERGLSVLEYELQFFKAHGRLP